MEPDKSQKSHRHHRHKKSFWQKVTGFFKKKQKADRPLLHPSIPRREDADFTFEVAPPRPPRKHRSLFKKMLDSIMSFLKKSSSRRHSGQRARKESKQATATVASKSGRKERKARRLRAQRNHDTKNSIFSFIISYFSNLSKNKAGKGFLYKMNHFFSRPAKKKKRKANQEDRPGRLQVEGALYKDGVEIAPKVEQHLHSNKDSLQRKYVKLKKSGWFGKLLRHWQKPWHNFLFFLSLKANPFDPFMDRDNNEKSDSSIIRFQKYFVYSFNSTVIFLISYITAYLIYQLAVIVVASFYDIDSVLFYYEVMFPIGDASPKWSAFNIIAITLSGPLVSVVLAFVYYKLIVKKKDIPPLAKLFFLWLTFHSFNMFFGAFVAGVVTNQGFGYVANWMFFGIVLKILFSLLALFALAYIGYRATGQLLATSNSVSRINKHNKDFFILAQAIIPWLVGSVILVFIKIPDQAPQHQNIIVYDLIIVGSLVLLVFATLINRDAKPAVVVNAKRREKSRLSWLFILLAILAIVFYRIALAPGLHFVIKLIFDVSFYR
jgi:hypothetical protein